jgi:hypothetical protein
MFTLVNTIECKVISQLKSEAELVEKIKLIANENEDSHVIIDNLSDIEAYIENYCDNLALLNDDEVNEFLSNHGIEVEDNEPTSYVELIMDNHKCINWNNKKYYISDCLLLTNNEEKICEILTYYLHV